MSPRYIFLLFLIILSFRAQAQVRPSVSCGVDDATVSPGLLKLMGKLNRPTVNARLADAPLLECRLGIDVDYGMYVHFNGEEALIRSYVLRTLQAVSVVMEKEVRVKLTVAHINFRKTDDLDPKGQSLGTYLYQMKEWWRKNVAPTVTYDCVYGFTTRRDPSAGGTANFGDILNNETVTLGGGGVTGWVDKNSLPVQTTAHELGHVFGSPHTHNCQWPGGPIDYCASLEGVCSETVIGVEYQLGTIMSYCKAGLTFHPLCQTLIRRVAESQKLAPFTADRLRKVVIPRALITTDRSGLYLSWDYSPSAEGYQVQVAADSSFINLKSDTLVALQAIDMQGVPPGQTRYWRVRAINSTGKGAWSETGSFRAQYDRVLPPPVLRIPAHEHPSYADSRFRWDAVEGATTYTIQLAQDASFGQVLYSHTTTETTTLIPPLMLKSCGPSQGCWNHWRVRAGVNGQLSDWSPVHVFSRPPVVYGNLFTIDAGASRRVGTTFPVVWQVDGRLNSFLEMEVSKSAEFTDRASSNALLFNKTGDSNFSPNVVAMANNLEPNQSYFYRVRASADGGAGVWKTGQFQTGQHHPGWSFRNSATGHLPPVPVTKTLPLGGGVEWVATTDGLYHFQTGQKPIRYSLRNTQSKLNGYVVGVGIDNENRVLALNSSALCRFDKGKWEQFKMPERASAYNRPSLLVDKAGTITVVSTFEILRLTNGLWSKESFPGGARKALLDRKGDLWVACQNTSIGLAHFDGVNWKTYNRLNTNLPQTESYINDMAIDSTGSQLWISGAFGLARFRPDRSGWDVFGTETLSPDGDEIAAIVFDRQNELVVIGKKHIYRHDGQKFVLVVNQHPFYTLTSATSAVVDPDNRLWIATDNVGLAVYDQRQIQLGRVAARYCAGDTVRIPFRLNFTPRPGTSFTAWATDSTGRSEGLATNVRADTARIALNLASGLSGQYRLSLRSPDDLLVSEASTPFLVLTRPTATITSNGPTAVFAPKSVSLLAGEQPGAVYQWFRDGVTLTGATSPSYAATQTGQYWVQVTNANGCSALSGRIAAQVNVALATENADDSIELMPNPATTSITIKLPPHLTGSTVSSVLDLSGRVLLRHYATARQTTILVQVSALSAGAYVLQVESSSGVIRRRFIKN